MKDETNNRPENLLKQSHENFNEFSQEKYREKRKPTKFIQDK